MRYLSTEKAVTPRQQRSSCTPELRTQAAHLIIESSRPAAEAAREISAREHTLSTWVSRYGQEHTDDPAPLSDTQRARLTTAEKEAHDLRLELELLEAATPTWPPAGCPSAWTRCATS